MDLIDTDKLLRALSSMTEANWNLYLKCEADGFQAMLLNSKTANKVETATFSTGNAALRDLHRMVQELQV